jgi:hypothetical protein
MLEMRQFAGQKRVPSVEVFIPKEQTSHIPLYKEKNFLYKNLSSLNLSALTH